VGGIGRAIVAAFNLAELSAGTVPVLLLVAGVGAVIGALAGLVGRVGLGAIVGAGLTVIVFLITLPVVFLFEAMGVGTVPSVAATVAIGALSGVAGGIAAGREARSVAARSR
jgi:hypothetical protein